MRFGEYEYYFEKDGDDKYKLPDEVRKAAIGKIVGDYDYQHSLKEWVKVAEHAKELKHKETEANDKVRQRVERGGNMGFTVPKWLSDLWNGTTMNKK